MELVPTIAVCGVVQSKEQLTKPQANAIAFASPLAQRLIPLQWKSSRPPSFKQWVEEMLSMIPPEKLRIVKDRMDRVEKKS